ncbi:hypothetical protein MFIFM68171_03633 [Madurella fahalii]|uniref:Uncharacterized protein n=1 Tax=Madurella fahalii TaxID=1157608 RepID=A0ABQ0G6N6_9PEZI
MTASSPQPSLNEGQQAGTCSAEMVLPCKAIKRQAEDVNPESPTKRRCILRATPSTHSLAVARPEPNSVNHILREHCRTRLYIAPILWKESHLRLLQCHFVLTKLQWRPREPDATQHSSGSSPTMQQPRSKKRYSRSIRAAKKIGTPGLEWLCESVLIDLLAPFSISRSLWDAGTPFRFGGRVVAFMPDISIYSYASTSAFLGVVSLATVKDKRWSHCHHHVRNVKKRHLDKVGEDSPLGVLARKRLLALEPTNKAEDPYIMAVLIAMAQEQHCERLLRSRPASRRVPGEETDNGTLPEKEDSFQPRLLALSGGASTVLYYYTACIPVSFLDKFNYPSRFSPAHPIQVTYYEIPSDDPERLVGGLRYVLDFPNLAQAPRQLQEQLCSEAPHGDSIPVPKEYEFWCEE